MERNPGLLLFAFTEAARSLDRMDDSRLAPYLNGDRDAGWVRMAFEGWPRDAEPPDGDDEQVTWTWQ